MLYMLISQSDKSIIVYRAIGRKTKDGGAGHKEGIWDEGVSGGDGNVLRYEQDLVGSNLANYGPKGLTKG